jgi:hypothetical protein
MNDPDKTTCGSPSPESRASVASCFRANYAPQIRCAAISTKARKSARSLVANSLYYSVLKVNAGSMRTARTAAGSAAVSEAVKMTTSGSATIAGSVGVT